MTPYWKCQAIGWSSYGAMAIGIPTLYGGMSWPVAARGVVGVLLGVALTHRLRRRMRERGWLHLPLHLVVPRAIGAVLVIAALMVLGVLPFLLLFIPPPGRAGPIAAIFVGHVGVMVAWIAIYFGYHYLSGVRSAEREKWRLELATREAELRALRAQLNPHFLFNSLNSLRALVTEDPNRAQEAVTGLAALLRYALQLSRMPTTTLERELEATRYYLALEALRFEDRLAYRIEVDPRALEHPVPPLLVQTIVENGIKHGIAHLSTGGSIAIEARKPAGDLEIRVRNTGTLTGMRDSGGVGLATSLEQLRLIFGDRARLTLSQSGPNEVTCDVVVPGEASRSASDVEREAVLS